MTQESLELSLHDIVNNSSLFVFISNPRSNKVMYANKPLLDEIGFESLDNVNKEDIIIGSSESEMVSFIKDKNGVSKTLCRWFTAHVNSKYNFLLHFGYPIMTQTDLREKSGFEIISNFHRSMINMDKQIISNLRSLI